MISPINFEMINPHDEEKSKSFERLTYALFCNLDEIKNTTVQRFDDASGDGGVEAISDSGIALQAKYLFTSSKNSGFWEQLNRSVKQAFKNYGDKLTGYYIFAPCHLRGQKVKQHQKESGEELEQIWLQYVTKWKNWFANGIRTKKKQKSSDAEYEWCPQEYGRIIDFKFFGADDIRNLLLQKQNSGYLWYWFNSYSITPDWFNKKLRRTLDVVDVRYSEANHVDTHILEQLQYFCKPYEYECKIRKYGAFVENEILKNQKEFNEEKKKQPININELLNRLVKGDKSICSSLIKLNRLLHSRSLSLGGLEETDVKKRIRVWQQKEAINKLIRHINELIDYCNIYLKIRKRMMLLTGAPGVGKTHSLASLAKCLVEQGHCCVMATGECVAVSSCCSFEEFLVKLFDDGYDFENLLKYINTKAKLQNKYFIIICDAINEFDNPKMWMTCLKRLSGIIEEYQSIKFIFSCKKEYLDLCVPENIREKNNDNWYIEELFLQYEDMSKMRSLYFRRYNVNVVDNSIAEDFCRTPLELKIFCEACENKNIKNTNIGIIDLFDAWLKNKIYSLSFNCNLHADIVENAISEIAIEMWKLKSHSLRKKEVLAILGQNNQNGIQNALYKELIAQGVLISYLQSDNAKLRFPYELMTDYFIVKFLTQEKDKYLSEKDFKELVALEPTKASLLSVIYANAFHKELNQIYSSIISRYDNVVLNGLIWRSEKEITHDIRFNAVEYMEQMIVRGRFDILGVLLLIPNHPLNVRKLWEYLKSKTQTQLDIVWNHNLSKYLHINKEDNVFDKIIDEIKNGENVYTKEKVELLVLFLGVCMGSNTLRFRKVSTDALAMLLSKYPEVTFFALKELTTIVDSYVHTCLYASVAKSLMSCVCVSHVREVVKLAANSYFRGHSHGFIARRYIELMIKRGVVLEALNEEEGEKIMLRVKNNTPVYKGLDDEDVKRLEASREWHHIVYSTRTECDGWYGNFGRYVMTYFVHNFKNATKDVANPSNEYENLYNLREARAIVLRLIQEIGWSSEKFDSIDNIDIPKMDDYFSSEKIVERFGKKYQWIALDYLLASLDDNYHLSRARGNLDSILLFDINDIDFVNGLEDFPNKYFKSLMNEVESNILKLNYEYVERLKNIDVSDFLIIDSDCSEPYLMLAAQRFADGGKTICEDSAIDSRLDFGAKCWLVENEALGKLQEYCNKQMIVGNGYSLADANGFLIGLYPQDESQCLDDYREFYWLRDHLPVYNTAVNLSFNGDSQSILVPTFPVMKMLGLVWNAETASFVNGKINTRLYNGVSPYCKALYISCKEFLKSIYETNFVPVIAIWGQILFYDDKTEERIFDTPVSFQQLYLIDCNCKMKKIHDRYITREKWDSVW